MSRELKLRQVFGPYRPSDVHSLLERYRFWLFVMLGIAFTAIVAPLAVYAQGSYPQPVDSYVNDYAKLLTTEDAANLRTLFADLKRATGVEAVAVTINSISDYQTGDKTIESFATKLFNTWGIGDSERNNGVLILVAVADRKVRIELGAGYGNAFDAKMQGVINEQLLPSFRRNEYSQGIYQGARAVINELTGAWPPNLARPTSTPAPTPTRVVTSAQPHPDIGRASSDASLVLVLGGVVTAIGAATFGLTRYYRRRCPNCKARLIRLDEVSDDVYLDSGQKLEELLHSVNYDVWKCPNCGTHTVHPRYPWFTSVKSCPQCHYRTLKVAQETLVNPTYASTGEEQITRHCRHCDFRDTETVILPVLTHSDDSSSSGWSGSSSSSDSSSFGGGQSSGGGASGSW
jgi:uncharacterized protein